MAVTKARIEKPLAGHGANQHGGGVINTSSQRGSTNAENLLRAELSPKERAHQTGELVALLSESKGVKVGRKKGAPKGNNNNPNGANQHEGKGRTNKKGLDLSSTPPKPDDDPKANGDDSAASEEKKPTAIELVATQLGVSVDTVTRRPRFDRASKPPPTTSSREDVPFLFDPRPQAARARANNSPSGRGATGGPAQARGASFGQGCGRDSGQGVGRAVRAL